MTLPTHATKISWIAPEQELASASNGGQRHVLTRLLRAAREATAPKKNTDTEPDDASANA